TAQDGLEQTPQQIAITEAAMPVLREGRMVGYIAVEPKTAEPAVRQIEVNLIAQSPLRADAEAVTHDQHPDHQLGINRWSANGTVERRQLPPQFAKLREPVDRAQQMISRNVPLERELIEQRSLFD